MNIKKKSDLFFLRLISTIILVTFSVTNTGLAAPAVNGSRESVVGDSKTLPPAPHPLTPDLGSVDESYKGTSDKTVYYIQDAHDSLEAQENIAKIIASLVEKQNVKTVFEEGYEGAVPTQDFFGFMQNSKAREMVSYFLLDKLRIGAAEYAHINRAQDFKLIGADSIKLQLENIKWSKKNAENQKNTAGDLARIQKHFQTLSDKYFPKALKEQLKLRERFDNKQLGLADYIFRLFQLVPSNSYLVTSSSKNQLQSQYPHLAVVTQYLNKTQLTKEESKDLETKLKAVDAKTLFQEIEQFEQEFVNRSLVTATVGDSHQTEGGREQVAGDSKTLPPTPHSLTPDQERNLKIYQYSKTLSLLQRLNNLEVTPEEYEVISSSYLVASSSKNQLPATNYKLPTQDLADFIAKNTGKPVVLSKQWEENIKNAVAFYETAKKRDEAINASLETFAKDRAEKETVLVYGGFHKEEIKGILKKQGFSYVVISPRITKEDPKHHEYYTRLLTSGYHEYEIPAVLRRAVRQASYYTVAKDAGREPVLDHFKKLYGKSLIEITKTTQAVHSAIAQALEKVALPQPLLVSLALSNGVMLRNVAIGASLGVNEPEKSEAFPPAEAIHDLRTFDDLNHKLIVLYAKWNSLQVRLAQAKDDTRRKELEQENTTLEAQIGELDLQQKHFFAASQSGQFDTRSLHRDTKSPGETFTSGPSTEFTPDKLKGSQGGSLGVQERAFVLNDIGTQRFEQMMLPVFQAVAGVTQKYPRNITFEILKTGEKLNAKEAINFVSNLSISIGSKLKLRVEETDKPEEARKMVDAITKILTHGEFAEDITKASSLGQKEVKSDKDMSGSVNPFKTTRLLARKAMNKVKQISEAAQSTSSGMQGTGSFLLDVFLLPLMFDFGFMSMLRKMGFNNFVDRAERARITYIFKDEPKQNTAAYYFFHESGIGSVLYFYGIPREVPFFIFRDDKRAEAALDAVKEHQGFGETIVEIYDAIEKKYPDAHHGASLGEDSKRKIEPSQISGVTSIFHDNLMAFNPLSALKDEAIFNVFRQIIERRYDARVLEGKYHIEGVPEQLTVNGKKMTAQQLASEMAKYLKAHAKGDPYRVADAFRNEFLKDGPPPELKPLFSEYMKIKPKVFDLEVIRDLIAPHGTIADIGAGHNVLGQQILEYSDQNGLKVRYMVGTDINDWRDAGQAHDGRLSFVYQDSPTDFPLSANSYDAVIVKWVLHHMSLEHQKRFLKDLERILKPGGRLIVFEALGAAQDDRDIWSAYQKELQNKDSWGPAGAWKRDNLKLNQDFRKLSPEQQKKLHALEDYFGHNVVMNRVWMPQPFTYRTVTEFQTLLDQLGFEESKALRRVYGSAPLIRMGPPSVRLVFEKKKTPITLIRGDGGQNKAMVLIDGVSPKERENIKNLLKVLVYQDRLRRQLEKERLDDIVILGNERLDTFEEALQLLNDGVGQRIVILGGYGMATTPLIDAAVKNGFKIEISPGTFVDSRHWGAIKSEITEANRHEILRTTEADIIRQIIQQIIQAWPKDYAKVVAKIKLEGLEKVVVTEGRSTITRRLLINYRTMLDREGAFHKVGGHKILFIQKPHLQFRAKVTLDEIFASELRDHTVATVSHTVSYDNVPNDKLSTIRELLYEAWRIVLYSDYGKGYFNLRGMYPKGINGLPQRFWQSAVSLFVAMPKTEKIKLARELMQLTAKEGLSIRDIVPEDNDALRTFVEKVSSTASGASLGMAKINQLLLSGNKEDIYERIENAFQLYKQLSGSEPSLNPSDSVSLETLTVLLIKASHAPREEQPVWARFFCQVESIRKAWQELHFPGVIDWLENFSNDLIVSEALREFWKTNEKIKRSDRSLPAKIARIVLSTGSFSGKDLLTIPAVSDASKTKEMIMILKPPTSFNAKTIIEAVQRIQDFGDEVVGVRVYSGGYFAAHPEVIGSQYMEAWEGYMNGIQKPEEWAEVRRIYGTDEFRAAFGVPYDDRMVIPAVTFIEVFGNYVSITDLWEKGRAKELFHNGRATGLNKVGSGRSVFPIQDPLINGGKPLIAVNGYVPSLLSLFQKPDARTVVFLIRNREGVPLPMSWETLRKQLLGDENNPPANPAGSIRGDAWTGNFPVEPKGVLNGQKNVAHLSSGPLEGLREAHIMMERAIKDTPLGQLLLKAGYGESQIKQLMENPRVRLLSGATKTYTEESLFALTRFKEPQEALAEILKYFPPFHELDPDLASTVSFDEFLEMQRAHQEGLLSVRNNRVLVNDVRVSSVKPVYFPGISKDEMERLEKIGIAMLQAGEVGDIVPGGGTGGRFGGYNLPESHPDRQKILARELQVGNNLRSALEIKAANVLWWSRIHGAKIPVLIMGNELNLPAIRETLENEDYYGLDPHQVESYQQNGIYRLNPTANDLTGPDSQSVLAANGDPGEIFRDDEGRASLKPAGHVEIIAQAILNRRVLKLARQGVKVLVSANGDDTRFLLDPAKIAYFMESSEQIMAALTPKDVTYNIKVSGEKYRIVVRGQKVIQSTLPNELRAEVNSDQTLKIARDGNPVDVTIDSKKLEKAGSLVDLRGPDGIYRPVILEGIAFPEELDQSQFPYISTNQLYFKIEALLDLFGIHSLDEYEAMPQAELARRVKTALSRLPLYIETKDVITAGENTATPQIRKAAQVARLVGDLTRVLKTRYIVIDRDGEEGLGGYGPLKEKQDAAAASKWLEETRQKKGMFILDSLSGKTEANPTPVLALTILDGNTLGPKGEINENTKILVGVRSGETNITHPNVISTPTQRVPGNILDEILSTTKKTKMNGRLHLAFPERVSSAFYLQDGVHESKNSHDPVVYAVKSLLAGKLGLAEPLEQKKIHFTATPVLNLTGSVLYNAPEGPVNAQLKRRTTPVVIENEKYLREFHRFVNVKVVIDNPDSIPAGTASYSHLRWITMRQFIEMNKKRDVSHLSHLFPPEEMFAYCIHGLCLLSSYVYLKNGNKTPSGPSASGKSLGEDVRIPTVSKNVAETHSWENAVLFAQHYRYIFLHIFNRNDLEGVLHQLKQADDLGLKDSAELLRSVAAKFDQPDVFFYRQGASPDTYRESRAEVKKAIEAVIQIMESKIQSRNDTKKQGIESSEGFEGASLGARVVQDLGEYTDWNKAFIDAVLLWRQGKMQSLSAAELRDWRAGNYQSIFLDPAKDGEKLDTRLASLTPRLFPGAERFHLVRIEINNPKFSKPIQELVIIYLKAGEKLGPLKGVNKSVGQSLGAEAWWAVSLVGIVTASVITGIKMYQYDQKIRRELVLMASQSTLDQFEAAVKSSTVSDEEVLVVTLRRLAKEVNETKKAYEQASGLKDAAAMHRTDSNHNGAVIRLKLIEERITALFPEEGPHWITVAENATHLSGIDLSDPSEYTPPSNRKITASSLGAKGQSLGRAYEDLPRYADPALKRRLLEVEERLKAIAPELKTLDSEINELSRKAYLDIDRLEAQNLKSDFVIEARGQLKEAWKKFERLTNEKISLKREELRLEIQITATARIRSKSLGSVGRHILDAYAGAAPVQLEAVKALGDPETYRKADNDYDKELLQAGVQTLFEKQAEWLQGNEPLYEEAIRSLLRLQDIGIRFKPTARLGHFLVYAPNEAKELNLDRFKPGDFLAMTLHYKADDFLKFNLEWLRFQRRPLFRALYKSNSNIRLTSDGIDQSFHTFRTMIVLDSVSEDPLLLLRASIALICSINAFDRSLQPFAGIEPADSLLQNWKIISEEVVIPDTQYEAEIAFLDTFIKRQNVTSAQMRGEPKGSSLGSIEKYILDAYLGKAKDQRDAVVALGNPKVYLKPDRSYRRDALRAGVETLADKQAELFENDISIHRESVRSLMRLQQAGIRFHPDPETGQYQIYLPGENIESGIALLTRSDFLTLAVRTRVHSLLQFEMNWEVFKKTEGFQELYQENIQAQLVADAIDRDFATLQKIIQYGKEIGGKYSKLHTPLSMLLNINAFDHVLQPFEDADPMNPLVENWRNITWGMILSDEQLHNGTKLLRRLKGQSGGKSSGGSLGTQKNVERILALEPKSNWKQFEEELTAHIRWYAINDIRKQIDDLKIERPNTPSSERKVELEILRALEEQLSHMEEFFAEPRTESERISAITWEKPDLRKASEAVHLFLKRSSDDQSDAMRQALENMKPANVFIRGRDLARLSPLQRKELRDWAIGNPRVIRVIVFEYEGEKPEDLDLPNIVFSYKKAIEASSLGRQSAGNIFYCRKESMPEALETLVKDNRYRPLDDADGLLSVGLLRAQASDKELFDLKWDLKKVGAFFSLVGEALQEIIQDRLSSLVTGKAA